MERVPVQCVVTERGGKSGRSRRQFTAFTGHKQSNSPRQCVSGGSPCGDEGESQYPREHSDREALAKDVKSVRVCPITKPSLGNG